MHKTLTFAELVKTSKGLSKQAQQTAAGAKHRAMQAERLHTVLKRFRAQLRCSMEALAATIMLAPRLKCPECFFFMPVIETSGCHYMLCNVCRRADELTAQEAAAALPEVATVAATATN